MCKTANGGMLYPLEANHKHSEDPKVDHLLPIFEVSSNRQEDVACLFVGAPSRGVSGISSRLDHCYLHPGVPKPVERELGQGGSDAAALVVGVGGQHGDLTHAPLGIMKFDRHEADNGTIHLVDPHPRLPRSQDDLYRPPLISGNHLKAKFVEHAY
jgi:hypothetical protein